MKRTIPRTIIPFLLLTSIIHFDCGKEPERSTTRLADTSAVRVDGSITTRRPSPPKPIDQMNRAERIAFVKVLTDSGAYRCCIDPSCTMCLYETDETCRCGDLVKKKDPVCGECYRGWNRGKGAVKGVDPKEVHRQ